MCRANSGDGEGKFTQMPDLSSDLHCDSGDGVHFIDMNADGLDDLVCLDSKGNAYLSINQGDGDRGSLKPPTFKRVSDTALIKSTETSNRKYVVLADIDGDGRGDYGVVSTDGLVTFWRNGWVDDIPKYWQALGTRWTTPIRWDYVRFEDLNGDVSEIPLRMKTYWCNGILLDDDS